VETSLRPVSRFERQGVDQACFRVSIARYAARALPTGLGAGGFAPTFLVRRIACAEASYMRLSIRANRLVSTAQAETYMRCDQTGSRVTRRPLGAADWRGRLLHSDDAGTLRQNAAELLLKARLMSVGNLTLTAIGCVNLHSYWAFPKFNIC